MQKDPRTTLLQGVSEKLDGALLNDDRPTVEALTNAAREAHHALRPALRSSAVRQVMGKLSEAVQSAAFDGVTPDQVEQLMWEAKHQLDRLVEQRLQVLREQERPTRLPVRTERRQLPVLRRGQPPRTIAERRSVGTRPALRGLEERRKSRFESARERLIQAEQDYIREGGLIVCQHCKREAITGDVPGGTVPELPEAKSKAKDKAKQKPEDECSKLPPPKKGNQAATESGSSPGVTLQETAVSFGAKLTQRLMERSGGSMLSESLHAKTAAPAPTVPVTEPAPKVERQAPTIPAPPAGGRIPELDAKLEQDLFMLRQGMSAAGSQMIQEGTEKVSVEEGKAATAATGGAGTEKSTSTSLASANSKLRKEGFAEITQPILDQLKQYVEAGWESRHIFQKVGVPWEAVDLIFGRTPAGA